MRTRHDRWSNAALIAVSDAMARGASSEPNPLQTLPQIKACCEAALDRLCESPNCSLALRHAVLTVRISYRLQWNGRFTRRMGDAAPATFRIRLSRPLWPRATREQRHNTITHELAHLVAERIRPGAGHGPTWRRIHLLMGGNGERCHEVDRTGLARTTCVYVYRCSCREHCVTRQRHQKIQSSAVAFKRGEVRFPPRCVDCKAGIEFVRKNGG